VFSLVRYVCVAIAATVLFAGNAVAATAGGPGQLSAEATSEEQDGPALLPLLEAKSEDQRRAGDLAQLTALRRRVLRIALATFGDDSPVTARAVIALAGAHIDRHRWLDAEPLLIIAARMLPDARQARLEATIYTGQTRVALARGDADAALALARRAVGCAERGRPQEISGEPMRAFGAALAMLKRFEEARQVLEKALAIDRRRYGLDAPQTARSLSQLGNLYPRWGRPADALPPLQEAAAIDQLRLGPAHPFIADDLHDLGLAYEALNHPRRARRLLLAALAVLERGAERDTPRVAYVERALSRIERQSGRSEEAAATEHDARRILSHAEAEERRRERRA
jgi:tetratricopeptide (TPR) repeat protein